MYYSGSMYRNGDWAVMGDDGSEQDFISIQHIYEKLKECGYIGNIWVSLDGPCSGMWVSQINKEYKSTATVFKNILFDSCTN